MFGPNRNNGARKGVWITGRLQVSLWYLGFLTSLTSQILTALERACQNMTDVTRTNTARPRVGGGGMKPISRMHLWAGLIRLLLLIYGAWHDTNHHVRYTDVDYDVFSDGAALVWRGRSPFERPTYRYTPLLAAVLTPNAWAHPGFGKLLFVAADLVVGAQIEAILLARRVPLGIARTCAGAWLFNPLALNVSTRGNSESLITVLLLGAVHALLRRRIALSAALLGCAIHLKPYPVIYMPAFVASLDAGMLGCASSMASSVQRTAPRSPFAARAAFVVVLGATCAALALLCYVWCGEAFVHEALLYHLSRQDVKHNFSPYFYALYLAPAGSAARQLVASLAFVPPALLLVALALRLGRDLPFCLFAQVRCLLMPSDAL